MATREAVFSKDPSGRKLTVVRTFDASLEQVWQAWTDSALLDQWWAPRPYRAETKEMDFREGGHWLYSMVGPEGDRTFCLESFRTIELRKLITNKVIFCDDQGHEDTNMPVLYWTKRFSEADGATTVTIDIDSDTEADLKTIIEMGFQGGFTMGLNNLEELLKKA